MTELKTLQDFAYLFPKHIDGEVERSSDVENLAISLKIEAIKWIKALELVDKLAFTPRLKNKFKKEITENEFTIDWIILFFDITEEDLKNG